MGRDDCPPVVAAHPPFWSLSSAAYARDRGRSAGGPFQGVTVSTANDAQLSASLNVGWTARVA